ncbi:MAG: hypothetical protein M0P61_06415 [Ignavibacteriaceae bacterium]|nr:hypothetical protein [Ignavibacteriaceae bacterium]
MKQLEKRIEFKGFVFIQETRNENTAIYQQWLKKYLIAYEVIRIRKNKTREQFGKIFLPSESYPTEKSWGNEGKTFKNLKDALKQYEKWSCEVIKKCQI